jgi:acetylornithine deacetylase
MKEQYQIAVELLQKLIQTQSFSSEEHNTAAIIEDWLEDHGVSFNRTQNNIWAVNKYFDENKPTILLNSHHDTVRPNKGYTNDPYDAFIEGDKLYGLGSNDAGGCLVSLLSTFVHFYEQKNMKYNLAVAATAEEESSGPNGLNSILEILPEIDFAIVGEPTEMHLAIAEKGLLVIDAYAKGIPGHAAHENTVNAITNAIQDIEWINNYKFSKVSDQLGKVKMSVTQIKAGELHNLVPAECHFVIDIRVNEAYSNREVFEIISENTQSELKPRSFKLNSSSIDKGHPLVLAGIDMGRKTYGSPTLSDQSVLSCNSVKLGPGVSLRSHSANEYILVSEIEEGIRLYKELLSKIL